MLHSFFGLLALQNLLLIKSAEGGLGGFHASGGQAQVQLGTLVGSLGYITQVQQFLLATLFGGGLGELVLGVFHASNGARAGVGLGDLDQLIVSLLRAA